MMMILRSAALVAAALTLSNCCMSGTGCSGPLASANTPAMAAATPVATPAAMAASQSTADWDGRVASSEVDTDMVMEPDIGAAPRKTGKRRGDSRVDAMSSQSSAGSRGRMSWEEEQAADLADEARLKQKLNICRNCNTGQ
ncbi:conserved exported protein of unknown function [Bradyrhizobium sp. ORS 285]|uniref:hypothetical protein n=1 Tax=Bradyrhizobium sp. ORS 285 TaxID=115808 RepID=UPI000240A5A0|nr:hypothetical protein [Bradyrhizobium sp. ORS 285]CCD85856.1 conserved exported hypothetical protein [Bradyrhizobium sp. ORS 285]SMX57759.1 conserved exported protein of unknown function [Bradyrhizobium sp. ORS 285]